MKKYKVVISVTADNLEKYIEVFKEQIAIRPNLEDSEVYIDASGKLLIDTNIEGYDKDEVSRFATEQIWELCSAILKDLNPLDVEVESVKEA